ncbi:sensor histidine kinase [Novosphingobium sp. SG720]|uniref:sensor histidine kinase n=1 Tax=Novosphingobium sp. SG720 TaxID=2586998 RepID=UPI001444BFAD|nr:sensor histidine kinase [Novosphingobium sp. SG720]NKJ43992.1 signal transduction histidine kinase/ligand-binding sensor domain-containing protein [Novosphingobium sp. SG720]
MNFSRWRKAGGLAAGLLALAATPLAAQRPEPALAGYKHEHWTLEEGAPGRINALTQSSDGFLWIGSVEGLFRFDGLTFEPVQPPGKDAARLVVSQLAATHDGTVWVGLGRGRGVMAWRSGRLVDMAMPHPSRQVTDMAQAGDGAMWVVRGGRSESTLARYAAGRWQEFGKEAGLPAEPAWSTAFAADGTQWLATETRVLVRQAGATRFVDTGIAVTPRASLAPGPGGAMWLSDAAGTRRIAAERGHWRAGPPLAINPDPVGGTRMLFDSGGTLWETTWNTGVLRLDNAGRGAPALRRFAFDATQGLTSDQTHALLQDREGNLWIGTELGLDKLRRVPVVVETAIPANSPTSYRLAAASDGTVYVADARAAYAIAPGRAARPILALPSPATALCPAHAGGAWLVRKSAMVRLGPQGAAGATIALPPGLAPLACGEDGAGRLWLAALDQGLWWRAGGAWHAVPAPGSLPANIAIGADGRAVVVFRGPPPAKGAAPFDTPFVALPDSQSRVGGIEGLLPGDAASGPLISGARGIEAPLAANMHPLPATRYPWAASLNGLVRASNGDVWGIGDIGIVRLRAADLATALARHGTAVPWRLFDFRDGLNSFVQKAAGAQVAQGGDGRIWFLTRRNVVSIAPDALRGNPLPPAVLVRAIVAGGAARAPLPGLRLPAGTHGVRIDFTATSLTVPQRVLFRTRLSAGSSSGAWTAPSPERSAVFTDLGPGDYTFEVIAANEDGVWNPVGQRVRFAIARRFYQTWWFPLAAILAVSAALYLVYMARVQYLGRLIRDRMAEREMERARIARELHDTLIQGVQGLLMRFQSVADRLAHDPAAQAVLVPALDRAEAMLIEGRDRVKGLRRLEDRHLRRELQRLLDSQVTDAALTLTVKGAVRPLHPDIVDEIVAIVGEAVCNAVRHAQATAVDVHVDYGARALALFVSDDGIGIATLPSDADGADALTKGHYGLIGMRERARRIGASFSIESGHHLGTLVRLAVPARLAYAA